MIPVLSLVLHRLTGVEKPVPGVSPLVTEEEACRILELPSSDTLDILAVAGAVRAASAPSFFNCGIVNARSGRCPEDCAFCAQSASHDTGVSVYPLLDGEALLRKAEDARKGGARRFGIVTSGTSLPDHDVDPLCRAVERIVRELGMEVCGSLGMLTPERARCYREAGMTRYHHNLETSASFFPHICTTHRYEEDMASVRAAASSGMEVCSGGIIGLGESPKQRVELAFTLAELGVDSIPINFLHAIPGTRLEHMPRLHPEEALRTLAVFRLIHPSRDILVAGGRAHVLGEWQSWLYAAGANGMMVGDYLTTRGETFSVDHTWMHALGVV